MSDLTVLPITVEHSREPVGIGDARPRLSWVIQTDLADWRQAAYEVEIEPEAGPVFSSGRVESAESVLVPWGAADLVSRDRRSVRVRVWGEGAAEPSAWSESVVVEAGLLAPADWSAELVQPALPKPGTEGEPAALLRREFVIDRPIVRARLYATAQGLYEAELNGSSVGDQVLAPGWTSYHHRLRYQTYDVTALLIEGGNAIGVQLADGWFRGHLGFAGKRNVYGHRTGAFAQLEVDHADGTRTTVITDGSWRSTLGPLTRADIYNGETYDARRERQGWSTTGFDDSSWSTVETSMFASPPMVLSSVENVSVSRCGSSPSRSCSPFVSMAARSCSLRSTVAEERPRPNRNRSGQTMAYS